MLLLRVLTGRRTGKVVAIVGEEFVVGSSRGCDLMLADEGVAERHAVLRRRPDGGYVVEDLGTRGGTFVAGRRIRGPVHLQGSEELCFGYTYAVLKPAQARRRRARRVPVAVAVAAVAGIALVGALVGVLLPRTGEAHQPEAAAPALQIDPVRDETPTNALPAPAPAGDRPPAAAETEAERIENQPIVFREDFSDAGSGWELVSGAAASGGYGEGEYVIEITELGTYVTVDSGIETQNPVVSVTVRNPDRSPSAGFGILCRYESEQDFVALAAGTDGTAAILQRRDGELSVISGNGAWAPSANVPVNAPSYRLRADCRGSRIELFVNGRPAVSAQTAAESGSVGLFAAGKVEFRFDDVTIVDEPA